MIDQKALRRAMTEFVQTTVGTYSVGGMLYRLTDQCLEVLGCDGGGVSVGDQGRLRFVTATHEPVARIEEDQVAAQQGPCHTAYAEGRQVPVRDVATEGERWPDYCRSAIEHGCRAVLGVPMAINGTAIGAVNLYMHDPHVWDDEEREVAQLLADMASGYITSLRALTSSQRLTDQLQAALDSRVVIEQAKGVLASRHRVQMHDAFEMMRQHARRGRRHLHEVAQEVVEDRLEL